MGMRRIIKTGCGLCHGGCGLLVHVENNEIVKITGDPESPINRGVICLKAAEALKQAQHPDRLKYPLRRVGERGSGKWEKISWDEAFDIAAEAFTRCKEKFGPESVIFIRGGFKGNYEAGYVARLANAFGTPNTSSMASVCFIARVYGDAITYGFSPYPDYEYPPSCIMVWGANMPETRIGEGTITRSLAQQGTKLIVVDPRKFDLSRKADISLQVRPGSDLALALGFIHVIITEDLYDHEFVEKWTTGFAELKKHVSQYSPESVEEITWVPATLIRDAARLYATSRPAIIQVGNGIDNTPNNFQTARALAILRAITGNIGIPGGELQWSEPPTVGMRAPVFDLRDNVSKEVRDNRLNAQTGFLPIAFHALPQSIMKAILEGDPYRIHAAYVRGGNLLLSYTNAQQVYKALKQIDFLMMVEMFMTPTAAMADLVLPVCSFLEADDIIATDYFPLAQVQQKIIQVGECRSDYEILSGLARKMGLGEYFWENAQACLDFVLEPSGLSFEEFRKVGAVYGQKQYRKHERDGFSTPSKRVELYSQNLEEWGFDPLPTYREIPETPYSAPELAEEYPLVVTSWKVEEFHHSGQKQVDSLRKRHPRAIVSIHPDTAAALDIADGDVVYIETKRGRIQQTAHLTADVDRRVVGVDFGWWFPEKGSKEMYGWKQANVNMLTDDAQPWGRELGSPSLRGFLCKVYKATE
jgi:anaerobic selenocysteine-containing dehydrogenase